MNDSELKKLLRRHVLCAVLCCSSIACGAFAAYPLIMISFAIVGSFTWWILAEHTA